MTPRSPEDGAPPTRSPAGSNPAGGTIALYLRISEDRSGEQVAVSRQRDECRALAERLGFDQMVEYVDNDISATSGAQRPAFERMIRNRPSAIVAWHQDRLLRLTSDLEKVIALDVPVYTVTAGTMDLSTPAGRAVARTVAAWSTYEGEQRRERQRSKNAQQVRAGTPLRGNRPFGFELDRLTVREVEAALIREAYEHIEKGGTLYDLGKRWNAANMKTTRGNSWSYATMRQLLLRESNAGRLVSRGEVVRDDLPRIVEPEQFETVKAILTDPRRETAPGPKVSKHLLAGIAVCGACGGPMRSATVHSRGHRYAIYRCGGTVQSRPGRHTSIRTKDLEWRIPDAVYDALRDLVRRGQAPTTETPIGPLKAKRAELSAQRVRVQELAILPGADLAWTGKQLASIATELEEVERLIAEATRTNATANIVATVADAVGFTEEIARQERRPQIGELFDSLGYFERFLEQWTGMVIEERRALIRATITVAIHPVDVARKRAFVPIEGQPGYVDLVELRDGPPRVDIQPINQEES